MSYENFIVSGKCFLPRTKNTGEEINVLNRMILDIMNSKGYTWFGGNEIDLVRGQIFPTMTFSEAILAGELSRSAKIKRTLGLKSDVDLRFDRRRKMLRKIVNEHPLEITFKILDNDLVQDRIGFIVEVDSEAAIVWKMKQLSVSGETTESHYLNIVLRGKQFVTEIMRALGARIIVEPDVVRPRQFPKPSQLIDPTFLSTLPGDIAACLDEGNRCFVANCNYAAAIMLRKSIEVASFKKLLQLNKRDRLYDGKYEIGLDKKLDVLTEVYPKIGRYVDEIKLVKWFGDVGAHDSRTPIEPSELQIVAPKLKAFLVNLDLKR
jgi:hypothetical protein